MKAHYLLTILAEDRKGLISIITSMLNRKGIAIESINAGRTDVRSCVHITLEVLSAPGDIKYMTHKIRNMIEVEQINAVLRKDSWYQKIALFILEKEGYNLETYAAMQKYGAVIVGSTDGEIIIQKTGRDEDILLLYNELDSPFLKSFTKSAVIAPKLPVEDQSSVISRAA